VEATIDKESQDTPPIIGRKIISQCRSIVKEKVTKSFQDKLLARNGLKKSKEEEAFMT